VIKKKFGDCPSGTSRSLQALTTGSGPVGRLVTSATLVIPKRVDHHALAQFLDPIEVMQSGSLINVFQASQQFATISS